MRQNPNNEMSLIDLHIYNMVFYLCKHIAQPFIAWLSYIRSQFFSTWGNSLFPPFTRLLLYIIPIHTCYILLSLEAYFTSVLL